MSIFKETFPDEIAAQIQLRQNLLVRRSAKDLSYLNSRKAWVRFTSGVDTLEAPSDEGKKDPTNALAKQYVLQGGTLYNSNPDVNAPFTGSFRVGIGSDTTNAYSTKTPSGKTHRLGIRPMPGITSIDIKSKSAYGSLREATVNFICWDIKQLEDLELLYMRPGFTALLEWGWSPYIGNNDSYTTLTQLYDKFLSGDVPPGDNTLQDIYRELHQLSKQQSGNYDALVGYVKNFQWSFRADGGYDCVSTIISFGEVLESLKINYAIPEISTANKIRGFLQVPNYTPDRQWSSSFPTVYNKSKLAGLLYEIASYMATTLPNRGEEIINNNGVSYSNVSFGGNYYDLFALKLSIPSNPNVSTQDQNTVAILPASNTFQYYITLESLCQLLNRYILVTTKNGSLAGVSTLDRKYNTPLPSNTNTPPQPSNPQQLQGPYAIQPAYQPTTIQSFANFTGTPPALGVTPQPTLHPVTGSSLLCLAHPLELSVDPSICLVNSPVWIKGFNFPRANENVDTGTGVDKAHNDGYGDATYSAEAATLIQSIIDFYIDGNNTNPLLVNDNILAPIATKIQNYFKSKTGADAKIKALEELVVQYEVKRGGKKEETRSEQKIVGAASTTTTITTKIVYPSELKATSGKSFAEVVITSPSLTTLVSGVNNPGFPGFNGFLEEFLNGNGGYGWYVISNGSISKSGNQYKSVLNTGGSISLNLNQEELNLFINSINSIPSDHDYTSLATTIGDTIKYNEASENLSKNAKAALKFLTNLSPFFQNNDPYSGLGYISDIYVNLNYLYTLALNQNLESQDKKEKNEINVYDYLKTVVGDIQSSTGNINNFDIHVDPIDNIGRVIDINFSISGNVSDFYNSATVIEIQGLKSTARNVNLQSQIFPEQSSIVAISAQNGGGTIGLDNTTLVGFNRGIKDRILPEKYAPKTGIETPTDPQTKLVNVGESIGSIVGYLANLQGIYNTATETTVKDPTYNRDNSSEYKNALRDLIVAIRTITNDPNQFKAIIPTKISITMDGIGGIIIGNLFRIPDDSLPRGYKSESDVGRKLGYVVTGLSHKIDTGFWETTIDGQTVILEPNDPSNGKIDYASIIVTDPVPSPTTPLASSKPTSGFNQDDITTAMKFFISKGFTNAAAAAAVGSFLQESQLNPKIVNVNSNLSYNDSLQTYAAGIAQWVGPRRINLLKYARSQGRRIDKYNEAIAIKNNATKQPDSGETIKSAFSYMTLQVQLEFAENEMKNYKEFTSFKSSNDINFTVKWMYETYEGGDYTAGAALGSRVGYANDLLIRANNGDFGDKPKNVQQNINTLTSGYGISFKRF